MAGEIIENQTLSGVISNADGNTYINCQFDPYCMIVGDGITYVDCSFNSNCNSNPPQMILAPGTGSVLKGGMVRDPCTIFGMATVVGRDVLWMGMAGPASNVQGGMYSRTDGNVFTNRPCAREGDRNTTVHRVDLYCYKEFDVNTGSGSRQGSLGGLSARSSAPAGGDEGKGGGQ